MKKKYNIIYADPPWKYKQGKSMGTQFQGACDRHYNTMDIKKICELPINDIAAKDSILFMWCTFPMLQEGLEVIKAWGFQYKTIGFNWLKLNKDGTPFFGVGYYAKSNGEICLLATKGHPHKFVINNDVSQVVFSRKLKHSEKPKAVYTKIERLLGNLPKIELFARHKREGWDVWGNELPKYTQKVLK